MFLLFKCAFYFCWVLELVTFVTTPLYLYFQVLCQVLASNGRESKSYDMLSRKQILYPSLKNSHKITKSYYWSKKISQHAPGYFLDFISFEFSDLINITIPNNSSFADCAIFTDCNLVFPFISFEGFDFGSLLKVPSFELSNSSLCLVWKF